MNKAHGEGDRMREILAVVHGNVQGVFFRQFAKDKALELGITGTTENKPEGTVEVVAQGKESLLRKYLEFLYVGTDEAEVESVNVQWGPAIEPLSGFTIL